MKKTFLSVKGFSLIELLVVVGIIGIISAFIFANISSSREKARDGRRFSDLAQIQLALEQYFTKNSVYPVVANWQNDLVQQGYISKIPTDPSTGQAYIYAPALNRFDYILRATLERSTTEGLGGAGVNLNGYECNPAQKLYCVGPN